MFIKQVFIILLSACTICKFGSFGQLLVSNSKGPIKCLTLKRRPCEARPTLVNINSDKFLFYPFIVSFNIFGRSCNTIDDPYVQVCVPNKVKNMNVKVFDLMSRVNETNFFFQHESCECKCRPNESACNSKQKLNDNECWCQCNELDDQRIINIFQLSQLITKLSTESFQIFI